MNECVRNYIEKCDNDLTLVNYCMNNRMWNNAVSLMYFACFNSARAYWVYLGFEDTNSHKCLIGQFNKIIINERNLLEKEFGRFLTRLEKKKRPL